MRRAEIQAQSEVRWHDEFAKVLTGMLPDDGASGPSAASGNQDIT
jgi:hypothetical protein